MEQKKLIQIIIIFVVALWAFCASLLISASVVKKAGKDSSTTLPYNQQYGTTLPSATKPTTTAPTTEYPTLDITLGNNISSSVNVGDPDWKVSQDASISASKEHEEINKNVPVGKDNIVKAYVEGVNKLKNTENFTMVTTGELDIDFDQITGGEIAENAANSAIAANSPPNRTYFFQKGYDAETGQTPVTVVPPSGSFAKLTSDSVKQATATATGDGGYKITITLKDETQTLTQKAESHSTAIEAINLASYMPNGVTLDELSLTYSGATVEVVFDKDKRITSMTYTLPFKDGKGSGTYSLLGKINIALQFHGKQTRSCTISY